MDGLPEWRKGVAAATSGRRRRGGSEAGVYVQWAGVEMTEDAVQSRWKILA